MTAWLTPSPLQPSVRPEPTGVRPRDGFSPNRPQHEAGTRIEPPPSVACAAGTTPAATRAAAPPEEPPALRSRFQGLRVAPYRLDSVVTVSPNSGVVEVAKTISPAARRR